MNIYTQVTPTHTFISHTGSTYLLVFFKDIMLVVQNQEYCYMCMDIKELCNQVLIIILILKRCIFSTAGLSY
jgi:hypothetical protein